MKTRQTFEEIKERFSDYIELFQELPDEIILTRRIDHYKSGISVKPRMKRIRRFNGYCSSCGKIVDISIGSLNNLLKKDKCYECFSCANKNKKFKE